MQTSQTTFPVHVRTRWLDFSPAFHWHAMERPGGGLQDCEQADHLPAIEREPTRNALT
jgi:hypothetical protein